MTDPDETASSGAGRDDGGPQRAAALYEQAVAAHDRHDYWTALELCERSLMLDDRPEARELRSRLWATVGPA